MAKQAFLLPVHMATAGGGVAAGLPGLHTGGGAGPGLQTGAGPGDQHNGPSSDHLCAGGGLFMATMLSTRAIF